jgi:hypothetical protein
MSAKDANIVRSACVVARTCGHLSTVPHGHRTACTFIRVCSSEKKSLKLCSCSAFFEFRQARPGFDIIPSTRVVLGKDLWQCLSGCAVTCLPSAKPHSAKAKALTLGTDGQPSRVHSASRITRTRLCSNSSWSTEQRGVQLPSPHWLPAS